MNKKLHFSKELTPLLFSGKKTSTWRLWDDKKIRAKDVIELLESGSEKHILLVKVIKVIEKKMGKLTVRDKEGHEKFSNDYEMYKTYSEYYQRKVTPDTLVKIIWFKRV